MATPNEALEEAPRKPLITPISAISLTWAISSKFSQNEQTREHGIEAEKSYKELLTNFKEQIRTSEKAEKLRHATYYGMIVSSIDATLKNLDTFLKYRERRTKEIIELRTEKINSINRMKTFGLSLENAFPKITSSAAIGGIAGLSVTQLLRQLGLDPLVQNVLILTFLGIGYLITEFVVSPLAVKQIEKTMKATEQDLRNSYDRYRERCCIEMCHLYETLKVAHQSSYGGYEISQLDGKAWDPCTVIPPNESHQSN
jgi:hypothetical protein